MRLNFTKFLILTCFLICFSSAAFAEQLKFIQVTDTHITLNGSNYQGRDLEQSVQNLETLVKSINKLNGIDFVVFSGDNIDSANEDNLRKFCEITKNLNKPYYITIGDHDVFSSALNKTNYFKIVKQYNKNQKSTDSEYYFFPNKDIVVIVMDGTIQMIPCAHGCYNERDLEWLDEVLTKYKDKKAIIVQHFPMIEPYENKSHKLRRPEEYFNLLANHKNVIAILSGHYHGGDKITVKDNIYHVSTPAFVNSPYNYRIIDINYDKNSLFQEKPVFELKTEVLPLKQQPANQTN